MNPISDLSLKHYSKEDEKIDMENQENMLKNQEKLAFFKKKNHYYKPHSNLSDNSSPISFFTTHPDLNLMFKESIFCVHPIRTAKLESSSRIEKPAKIKLWNPPLNKYLGSFCDTILSLRISLTPSWRPLKCLTPNPHPSSLSCYLLLNM